MQCGDNQPHNRRRQPSQLTATGDAEVLHGTRISESVRLL